MQYVSLHPDSSWLFDHQRNRRRSLNCAFLLHGSELGLKPPSAPPPSVTVCPQLITPGAALYCLRTPQADPPTAADVQSERRAAVRSSATMLPSGDVGIYQVDSQAVLVLVCLDEI